MKKILFALLILVSVGVKAQVEVKDAMPYEFSPGVTSVVTLNFTKLPGWQPGEYIIIKIPSTNSGTVKINTVSATMGATTQTFAAGTEVTIPPLRVYYNVFVQCSTGADKIFIYR